MCSKILLCGRFLWVACQLDALKRCPTPAMLRQTLKGLPRTLHATYERMLSNIHEDLTDIVVAPMKLLVICHEKLTIRGLAEAVTAGMDSKSSFNIDNRFSNSEELLDILGRLVTHNTDYIADHGCTIPISYPRGQENMYNYLTFQSASI